MDNVAYHGHKSELLSTAAWRKEGVKRGLLTKNAPFPDDYLKRELLQAMWSVRNEYTSCVVDKMAEQKV
jgi:hypothetical protein